MVFDPYKASDSFRQRQSPGKSILEFLRRPVLLNRIVLILVIFYIVYLLTWLNMYLFAVPLRFGETDFRFFMKYIALSSSPESVREMPWTIFTHFLVYANFLPLIFHILVLAVFGRLFFDYWNKGKFLFLLFLATLAGTIAFIYSRAIFPSMDASDTSMLSGAGAAVFGLMIYMLVYLPDYVFEYMMIIRLKMKYLVLIIVAIDLLSFQSAGAGIHLSHLAGALSGGCFALISKSLKSRLTFTHTQKSFRTSAKKNRKYKYPFKTKTDEEYNLLKKQKQDKLDAILDKISRSGYGSLTEEEKRFLFYESKR